MMSTQPEKESLWQRTRRRYNRLRNKSQNSSKCAPTEPSPGTNTASNSHSRINDLLTLNERNGISGGSTGTGSDESSASRTFSSHERHATVDGLSICASVSSEYMSSDIWSAAYREAVERLGDEISTASTGRNAEMLFKRLEEIEQDVTNESAFLRGVQRLRFLKTPLDHFKLALDLASPLTNLEPTTSVVFGVVRSVTAIAITFANADLDFAKQIADMLERISYIDECDTLGRRVDRNDIHKALVSVYQKVLEFYDAALTILTRKGTKMAMRMVLENDRLPSIVQDFLTSADKLQMVIQKATLEILDDIRTMLYSKDIAQWLKYENFALQSHLCSEWQLIRADQACAFLLEDSKFRSWYEALDSQQLVIFGGMGHGKSVAMAFIAERLSYRGKFRLPQPILCQYYCRDHETGKTTSVLSALTYSLLMQLEGLQKPFHERYKQAQEFHFDPALNAATMEGLLQSMLKTIDRPVIFIIDGMDECDYDSRNRLLKFLKRVLETTLGLKILVSFRHQQEIMEQLTHAAKIELDSSPARDLLIVEKTLEMLPFLSPDVKALITENLSQRAQGSAIWTKMVIELIKMRHLTTKSSIERLLDELPIPEKLSDVYTSIFSRSTGEDHQNWQLAITALKILASSRRALSILELAWAVALSLTREITTVEALQKEVDHQRVMSLIYPFITSPKYDEIRKPQVRLTHQSVKEWVFEQPDLQGSASKMPGQKQDISRKLDSLMLDICVKYLLLDEIGEIDLFSEEQAAFVELPQLSGSSGDDKASLEYDSNCTWETWEDDMARFDPVDRGFGEFFVYASCHWVDHFGRVPAESLSSLASIEKLCQAGSTRLRNWIQQNSRPSCTISPRFEFDSSLYDPLSITSIYGSESILRHMLERSRFESEDFFQESAIKAADQILQWANVSRLEILFLHSQTSAHLQKFELFRLVIKRWSKARFITKPWHKEQQDWDLVFGLVERMLDKMTEEQWGNELLCLAARAGCMPIVHRLVTSAKNKEELRKELFHKTQVKGEKPIIEGSTHRLIGNAILGDHADIVEYLLREKIVEPHFRHRNSLGENVLHLATRLCNPDMFRILIPHFQEGIDERDDQGDVPLVRIVMSPLVSRYEAARSFLLQTSINRDTKSSCWKRDSLRAAVSRLDLDMCCILIWIGKINPVAAFASGDQENVREENNVLSTLIDLFVAEGGNPVELADSREEALQILAEKHYRKCFRAEDPTKPTSSFAQENVLAVQTPIKNSSLATGWSIH